MPLLSVVVVGRPDAPLMRATDASMRSQDVDDLDLRTTEDPSSEARNRALDSVAGDYVWFVEPGDLLLPGSLRRVQERLRFTSPDVLLLHHAAIDARGKVREGPHRDALDAFARAGPRPLVLRPGLAGLARGTPNKVLDVGHVRALGARFTTGHFGELALTWPALAAADRIAAMTEPVYVRCRRRKAPGSPFDVFTAYDAVFSALPPERRALVLSAMLAQELTVLRHLPARDAREFFHRMSENLAHHRTGDERLGAGGLDRARVALVEHDAYAALRLLDGARGTRRALRARQKALTSSGTKVKRRRRRARVQRHYRARLRGAVDPRLAVYGAYWFTGYACNPRAIYEKARELAPEVRGVWVVKRDAAATVPPGVDYVVAGSLEYYDVVARAGHLINNVGWPDDVVVREDAVNVQTHHGTPLKYMGLDQNRTAVAGPRMDDAMVRRRVARWDYSIAANPYSTRIWNRAYPGDYETLEIGYPRNDALVNATEADVRRIRAGLRIEPEQIAVLYAPTHREYLPGYVPVLDMSRVAEALDPDHVLLARPHYFYDADPLLRELHRAGTIRDVASHPSIEELCLAADVLVTDYSSIMFDYAVLDRPIVIHAPDWEVYRTMRGTYFDLISEPPGVVTHAVAEVIDAVRSRSAWNAESARKRAAFRDRFCSLEDGRAAERVVRRLWLGQREAWAGPIASEVR
jgi:CDP-glycerol glycerophosphotransferase